LGLFSVYHPKALLKILAKIEFSHFGVQKKGQKRNLLTWLNKTGCADAFNLGLLEMKKE